MPPAFPHLPLLHWLLRAVGPHAVAAIADDALGLLAGLCTTNETPLPLPWERLRLAAKAAQEALRQSQQQVIVAPSALSIVPGGRG